MKLHVHLNLLQAIVTVFLLGFYSLALGQNSTQCSNGSTIRCEAGQFAWCRVFKNGKIDGGCKNPPTNKGGEDLLAGLLSEGLNKKVSVQDLQKEKYKTIFREWEVHGDLVEGKFGKGSEIVKGKFGSEIVKGEYPTVSSGSKSKVDNGKFGDEVVSFSISGTSAELRKALEILQKVK